MSKNSCSEFFLTVFPKKKGKNLEWQKNSHSEFFPTILLLSLHEHWQVPIVKAHWHAPNRVFS